MATIRRSSFPSRPHSCKSGRRSHLTQTFRIFKSRDGPDLSAHLAQILDLLAEDDRLNVYAGKLEVRPPVALTI
jgi:hypothetical protein